MTLPNFLVLGAAKCGTTSLYFYMQEHPAIYLAPKEVHFFSRKEFSTGQLSPKDLETYESLFDGVTNETAIGEVAIHYITKPWAATHIKSYLPNAKLIASLRHPIDRSLSHFLMHCRLGNIRTKDGVAVGGHPTPGQIDELFRDPDRFYIHSSMYYKHLKRYYDLYTKNQIYICLLEELESNAHGVMQGIFRYLDVDDTFSPDTSSRYNVTKDKSNKSLLTLLRNNSMLKRVVKTILPRTIVEELYRRRERGATANTGNLAVVEVPPEVRIRLHTYFHDDISRLEDLIERDLSAWRQ